MDTERHDAGLSRRQLIKRGAVVGGAALWVPPVIQSFSMPAAAQVGSPQPCVGDGFMTGSGYAYISGTSGPKIHYVTQGQLHCNPEPSDGIHVDWTITTGSGKNKVTTTYEFDLTQITTADCFANPGFEDPDPTANFNQTIGSGIGTLRIDNVLQAGDATITFDLIDGGEPGIAADVVTIHISHANASLDVVSQPLTQGNLQTHGNEAFGSACP